MNEKDLLYFCKLVETGNYTATAALFDVTQPTISMAIKRLSEKFDDPLILQKNRKSKITLTAAGEMLYEKAQILLQDMSNMMLDTPAIKNCVWPFQVKLAILTLLTLS